MAADFQVLFNIALAVAGAFGMWIMNSLAKNIERIDQDVRDVPDKYIQKDDFREAINGLKGNFDSGLTRVEKSIDAIFRKLDGKEDKSSAIGQRKDQ